MLKKTLRIKELKENNNRMYNFKENTLKQLKR